MTATTDRHLPAIEHGRDGTWRVFCLACSDAEGDYVYPCEYADEDYPPAVLVPARETTR